MSKKQYSEEEKGLAAGIYVETLSKIKAKVEYENAVNATNPSLSRVDVKFGTPQCTRIADFALDAAHVFLQRAYPADQEPNPVPVLPGPGAKVAEPTPAS